MLVVNEQVLEIARFTDSSPKIGNISVSFDNNIWIIEYPPKFLHLTTLGFARLKYSKMPIQLADEALLYFHPSLGLILHDW